MDIKEPTYTVEVTEKKTYTPQETFDTVVAHLRKQGCRATSEGGQCRYRTTVDGVVLRCAAGCLIPDKQYRDSFEGRQIGGSDLTLNSTILCLGHDILLVRALQVVHDEHYVRDWEHRFQFVANEFGLTYTPPEPT